MESNKFFFLVAPLLLMSQFLGRFCSPSPGMLEANDLVRSACQGLSLQQKKSYGDMKI